MGIEYWWRATRLWRTGINPYGVASPSTKWPLTGGLLYPLPALIVFWPFSWLPLATAAGAFTGTCSAILAWALTRRGEYWRLLIFVSPCFLMALTQSQWTPLLAAAALVPGIAFALAAKPTLGLAAFVYRPTRRGAAGIVAICLVSLALFPTWPEWWLRSTHALVNRHPIPLLTPFGWILAASLLRWRTPGGRLLAAMAVVPQLLCFYDQLAVLLVARTRTEAMILSLTSTLGFLGWMWFSWGYPDYRERAIPFVMLGCYLPALLIVLRHRATATAPGVGARSLPAEDSATARVPAAS